MIPDPIRLVKGVQAVFGVIERAFNAICAKAVVLSRFKYVCLDTAADVKWVLYPSIFATEPN